MKKRTSSMSRRIVSLLMSLVLTLTLVTPAAFAEGMGAYANGEDTEILTGTNSGDSYEVQEDTLLGISLYAAADSWDGASIAAVEPNAEGIYEISTAAQLAGLAALVNGTAKDTEGNPIAAVNFSGKTIKLTADIDLGNQAWTPIGNGDSSFAFFGTFDGNGYTISGLNVPDTNAPGLFGCIFGTVQNLIVKGSVTVGENADGGDYGEGGGVVCENRGTVQNCGFYGSVIDETGYLFVGGVAGGGYGKVLNCWYYKDAENSALGVCGDTATTTTNCVVISSSDNMTMTAGKLATLQTNAPETGKVWSWTEGDAYPTLIDPPKTITMQPVFPDCTAVVSANGTPLSADKKYTCEVTEDSVVITVSDSSKTLYYAANEGENTYTTEGENANLTKLESGTTFNKNDLPKTYYYGTEEDFRLLAAWNSAVSGKNVSITEANQLKALARMVNSGKDSMTGKTIMLGADIRLNNDAVPTSGNQWTPIGTNSKRFAGTFDGQGHTISGLYINNSLQDQGLFGYIDKSAIVQNLIVTGSVTTGGDSTGGIVGKSPRNSGTVRNCGFYGTVTATGRSGGVVGGGKAENCWYYSDGTASNLGVCGGTATNCVVISSSDNMTMTAGKLATLQTNAPETGKVWSWTEGDAYPTLIDPPKTITMQPVFPDCTAVVSANGTPLSADKKYTCEVTEDSVVITVSDSSKTLYYAANEGENTYTTEGENANLTKLESGTTFNKNDLPKTYYYGTEEDFRLLAAWNSAVSGKNVSITEANQLKALARMVNSGKDSMTGKTIMLGTNIVWDGSDWTPIGTEENPFKGTFTGYSRSGGYAAISGLSGDLFGVVEDGKTKIQFVTISGGTGRLVNTLISGTVENCMSTAKVTGAGGGLVGTSTGTGTGTGTVKNSYYYNENCKNTVAVSGDGTITNCYYLADTSTWGQTRDSGARTEAEFKAGRVTWELNGKDAVYRYNVTTYWSMGENDLPCLETYNAVYELTLTVNGTLPEGASLQLGDASIKVLTDGNTQYVYGANSYGAPMVPVSAEVPDGYQVMYSPNAPTNGKFKIDGFTKANNYYTVEFVKGDISWYEANKDSKSYAFKTADELVGFSLLVNGSTGTRENFEGWTLTLADNINLDGIAWTPIGQSNAFSGTFDGKGHTIEDMSANVTSGYAGLFGNVRGTVKNVQVTGSVTASGNVRAVGGIVGYSAGGTVQNCLSKVNILAPQVNCPVGGVVGESSNKPNDNTASSTVNLCWNEGTVTGGSGSTGGIVGTNSNGKVTNCANFGAVKGSSTAGGIVGIGTTANSYNLGDVTGAESGTYGISSRAATNSYYLCKLNGAVEQKYIKDSSSEAQNITATTEDNKTVYKVDGTELVELLNKNRSTYTEWINKQAAPYNPVHITRWDGSFEPGVEGVITLVYDPNGGEGAAVTEQQRVEGDTGSFTIKSDTELGFKHENGTFLGWSTNPYAKTADNSYDAGITVSVEKNKSLTLYAVWSPIWAGSGTEAAPYEIPDVGKLTALQKQVNENGFSYTGKWFRLTNNIDLNDELWTPIGVDALHSFGGSLDGGGKTISGLKVETNGACAGLFGSVRGAYGVPVTMRDLTLKNGSVKFTSSGTSYSGGLVAVVEGSIALELRNVVAENLTVSGDISGSGGLLGNGPAVMTDCHNRGGSVTGRYAGGLAGKGHTTLLNHVFTGCTNSAAVSGEKSAGGMTGNETYNDGSYTSCANSGSISATQGYASGIAAGGSYERCSNSGAVTGKQAAGIASGGIKATFCSNTGAITGTDYAAGILTNGGYGGVTEFCWNTGKVEASTPVKAFGILYGWGAHNQVRNSFSHVPGANIGLAPTELKEENVSDSYYLADKKDSVSSVGEWASADDFASGKVAWGVDGGVNAHKNYWTQGGSGYPIPIGEGTSTSYYRAQVTCGTGGTATIKRGDGRTGDADNAVYGPSGTKVTVTATPKDSSFALKSLTLDLMSTGTTSDLANPGSFALGAANAKVVATFASAGSGGGSGSGSGSGSGAGTGDENDEGLQDGMNMDVEYNVKGLVLSAYTEWGSNGGGKTFSKWLKDSPNVLRALISNSLDNMAAAAAAKKTDEASALAQALLASLNEHSGVAGKDGDAISKALQRFMTSGTEATFSTWLTTGSGMASGTVESIFTQYTDSLLALADRLYTKWESSGTSMTFPAWLDAQQVSMENLSETAEEPDTDTTNESQTTEAPEDVPDGQDTEGGASGNSVWEVIGTVVRENPILVWSIVAVIAALIIVGAVRRYHKVKRDEHDEK